MVAMTSIHAHIAVVEDDAPVRRALVRVLVSAGFTVSAYGSAEEFVALTDDPSPDCLLLDLHLPRMSGLELQDRMRRVRRDVPIVFITADLDIARSDALRHRGVLCLTKPIDEQTLMEAISRVTSHAPSGEA